MTGTQLAPRLTIGRPSDWLVADTDQANARP